MLAADLWVGQELVVINDATSLLVSGEHILGGGGGEGGGGGGGAGACSRVCQESYVVTGVLDEQNLANDQKALQVRE